MSQRRETGTVLAAGRSAVTCAGLSGETVRRGAVALALLVVAALTAVRVVRNAPVEVPGVADAPAVLVPVSLVGAALAVVVVGLSSAAAERTALVFVGVFGVLASVDSTAGVPAVGALVVGAAVVVGTDARTHPDTPRRWLVGALVLAGLAASLAASLGLAAPTLRPLGTTLALAGVATTPLLTDSPRLAWAAGALTAGVVLAVGLSAPFVTGAVTLVSTAAVGASLPLLALAVGGAVTAGTGLLLAGRREAACGVGLLLLAGVPATVPRATAVVLGLAVLLGGDRS